MASINETDWTKAKIREIANVSSSKRVHESEYVDEGVPFFRSKEVILRAKKVSLNNVLYISNSHFQQLKEMYGAPVVNDILVTAVGTIGCIYLVEDFSFYFKDGNLLWLNDISRKITPQFLAIYLASEKGQRSITMITGGSSQSALTIEKLKELTIKFPPVRQQKKIAKILSTIDQLIEKTQALIDKHTAIKQGMMADLFTRGIGLTTGQLRPIVEQAPHLYRETELGCMPIDWDLLRLDSAVTFFDGQRIPLKQEDRADMMGEIPYYGASGIIDYVNDYIFNEDLILLGEDGENVVSRNVPLSFQIHGKAWVNNHAHVLKPISNNDIDYLTEYLEFLDYSSIVSGSAQPKITQGLLAKLKIKIPTLDEQLEIGNRINAIKKKVTKEDEYLQKLQIVRNGLMQDLLTGKVSVN